MLRFNDLRRILAVALAIWLAAPSMLAANRKGEKFFKEGQAHENQKQYDEALSSYEQAYSTAPDDVTYQIALRRVRFQASQAHVDKGQKIRTEGKLEEALREFQVAYAQDPASAIAEQEMRRTYQMMEREKKKAAQGIETALEERGLTNVQISKKELEQRISNYQSVPELKPITRQIQSLKMSNQARVLFETVAKLAGVNVIFEPEYLTAMTGKTFSLDLVNSTLEEALDYLAILTKSYWKPLSSNTIFVTQDNVQKRRDFEDHVMKVFYLQNVTTVQELNEIATAVRSVMEARRLFTYNSQNAIIARGTVDQVALIEKLVNDLDKPKSEVIVDVVVMEANRTKTRDLALALMSGGTAGLNIPVGFTPRNPVLFGGTPATTTSPTTGNGTGGTSTTPSTTATAASTGVSLAQLGHISTNDFSLTLPGAMFQAMMTDRTTKILQNPQVRSVDNMKADLRIGDRYPYATGSFQPGMGQVGVSPLVSTQFQFADVGVNVSITPKVHSRNEVSLHVEIEISAVRDRIDVGGLSQPVIGQRKVTHDIRIKDGEITLLGGLMQTQDTNSRAGIPGLSSIPGLRNLFGTNSKEKNTGELMIALIPHIVRSPDYTENNLRSIATGNDQVIRLSYRPSGATDTKGAQPAPSATTPQAPEPIKPEAETAAPAQVPAQPPAQSPAQPPAKPPVQPRLVLNPPTLEARLGSAVTVTLQVDNATDLFSAPLRLKFDPKVLRLNEVTRGAFLAGDGQNIIFTRNIQNDVGEVAINLNRLPGSGGVSGGGTLITLVFLATGPGVAKVSVSEAPLRNSQLQPITVAAPETTITVK